MSFNLYQRQYLHFITRISLLILFFQKIQQYKMIQNKSICSQIIIIFLFLALGKIAIQILSTRKHKLLFVITRMLISNKYQVIQQQLTFDVKVLNLYINFYFMAESQQNSIIQAILCSNCPQPIINYSGGKCQMHKHCKKCDRELKWKCPCDDIISFSDNEEPNSVSAQQKPQNLPLSHQDLNPEIPKQSQIQQAEQMNMEPKIKNEALGDYELITAQNIQSKQEANQKAIEQAWQQKFQQLKQRFQAELIKNKKLQTKLSQLENGYEILEKDKKSLLMKIKQLQEKQKKQEIQKQAIGHELTQLKEQIQYFKENQQNQRQQKMQQTQNLETLKNIINDYHKMLIKHFQEINNNFSYRLALQKIKMVKSLITNFEQIMEHKNPEIQQIISTNKPLVQNYIKTDIQQFIQQISKMEITFEIFNTTRIKIVLQKLKLYKEIFGQETDMIKEFQNAVASKINHFLKTVVQKYLINNKTAKNQFVIIEYLNDFLIFQSSFEDQIKVIYQKCSENLTLIRYNLAENFKKIQNMYFTLKLHETQAVKNLHFNDKSIEVLVKLIISVKIMMKNKKYLLEFEKETKRKVNQFKDQINKKLGTMRYNIKKQISNKEVISSYDRNYKYFIILTKIKDFDKIWEDEENFYYNFKFTELYQTVNIRNEILKKVRIHQIHQMIGQEKIEFERLQQEIQTIDETQQIFSVLVCRIREIFTKKLYKLQKLNEFSSINCEYFQKFKQFSIQVGQLQKITKDNKNFENHLNIQRFTMIIDSKINILMTFLQKRFNYFLQHYNSPQFDQIQKEIKYFISFQQFLKAKFSNKHRQLRQTLKDSLRPHKKQNNIFKNLLQIIQEGKQFISSFLNSQIIKKQDYVRIKKFRKLFNSHQEQLIDKKAQKDINIKISQLQTRYWSKGHFDSQLDKQVKQNIDKLSSNLQANLKDKLQKLRGQMMEQMKKRQQEVKTKLEEQGNAYIKDNLLPLIRAQRQKKTVFAQNFQNILETYLTRLQEKQYKEVSKRQKFIEQYIHKMKDDLVDEANLRMFYEKLQYQTYKIQSANMPNLIEKISESFELEPFISKKTLSHVEQLDQLVNLRVFYQKSVKVSFLNEKKKESMNNFFAKIIEKMKQVLDNLTSKVRIQQIDLYFQHQNLLLGIIKMKIFSNFLRKISNLKAIIQKVQSIINKFNLKITAANEEIHNYSFSQSLSRDKISDSQIIGDLQKKDATLKNLINIQDFCEKNLALIQNRVVDFHIFQIRHLDLIKNLELSWRQFYQISIKEELNFIFSISQAISHKFTMFMRIKNIVRQKRIKIFNFIANDEYDIKRCLMEESKRIFLQTERHLKECSDQYGRYFIQIKGKQEDMEKKRIKQIKEIEEHYKAKENQIQTLFFAIDEDENQQAEKQKEAKLQNIKKLWQKEIQEINLYFKQIIDELQGLWVGKKIKLFKKIIDNIRVIKKLSLDFTQQGIKIPMQNFIKDIFKEIQQLNLTLKDQFLQIFYQLKTACHLVANIVQQITLFEEFKVQSFNQSVKHQDIHYVMKNCAQISCRSEQDKAKLLNDFQQYEKEVKRIQKSYKQKRTQANLTQIVNDTISSAMNLSPPILLGRIFAIQSILRIKHKEVLKFIRNPHPSQIVTILLLTQSKNQNGIAQLCNGMAQVKTGEGKSVVLAGLCSYLALKGYHAYCACYSAYLSIRDEKEYHHLFERLNLLDRVTYGTFADHCKGLLDERDKNCFKDVIKQCLLNNSQQINHKFVSYLKRLQSIFQGKDEAKRVLIIDEVDVFFQQRYFGQFYRPAISLENQSIKQLIKLIWSKKQLCKSVKSKQQLKTIIKNSNFFQDLIKNWTHLSSFFENQLQGMICAAADPQHSIELNNQKIVYRYNGVIEQSLNMGYKTVFSACSQIEKKTISKQFYEKTLRISLIASEFSYAELPKYFTNILGVSGTLQTLSKSRKDIMREKYNIHNFFILPSIYGNPNRTILNPLVMESNYEAQLINKIQQCCQTGRPVLVFFQTRGDMISLFQSQGIKENLSDYCFLTQDEEDHMRDSIIRLAGRRGRVTFMTSYFSRGTDFILQDKNLIEAGGFHVVQAYISKDESDYVQVYGRTARQGKKGSFQMIVKAETFTKYNITNFDSTLVMGEIKNAWNLKDQIYGEKLKQKIIEAQQIHEKSYNIIKSLSKGTKELIKQIQRLNYIKITASKNIKSVIAIDGTGSMGSVLAKVKQVLKDAIIQTEQIIQAKNVNASFQQQTMIYRNYNSKINILECSGFMNDSKDLTNWVGNIQTSGGDGNEAIQVVYNKINSMKDVNQVIIIGDARCNTKAQMISKRKKINATPQFWKEINIPFIEQSPEQELQILITKKIPIHSLYIVTWNKGVKQYFTEISTRTNGKCNEFKINQENAGKILADFIAENVLNQIGGEELVNQYRLRFG